MVGIFFSPLAPGGWHLPPCRCHLPLPLAAACRFALACAWLFFCAGGAAQYLTTPTLGFLFLSFPLLSFLSFPLLSSSFSPPLLSLSSSFSPPFLSLSSLGAVGGCWCIAPHCRRSGVKFCFLGKKMALLLACEIKTCYFCSYGR